MRKVKLGELVLDYNLYPRMQIDAQHVSYMKESMEAGNALPPIVVCIKSLRVIDGFHRHRSYQDLYGSDFLIEVVQKKYRNEAEMLLDAIRLNASHGRMLSRYDRAHCILLAEKYNLSIDDTARALGMTVEKVKGLRIDRVGKLSIAGQKDEFVPLKQTIRHMAGLELTPQQAAVNRQLSGMNQVFYVNQLISLIETGLLDTANAELLTRLSVLGDLIRSVKVSAA